ncbi:hypothetical protein IMSAGC022_01536 [Alistipes sp.]|nr:hypothetical protein IMSAGC022_01536 [Alistipes sp.]
MTQPLKPISPISVRLRIFGHDVCLTVLSASCATAGQWLNNATVDASEFGSIQHDLCMHRLCGEFETVSERIYTRHDCEPLQYAGTWQVIPDFRQFLRIFRWWYNHALAEALTQQSFELTYGRQMGRHYYDKWCLYERSISRMVGYFGTNITQGQKFLDMLMEAVARYERREKAESAQPIPAPITYDATINP